VDGVLRETDEKNQEKKRTKNWRKKTTRRKLAIYFNKKVFQDKKDTGFFRGRTNPVAWSHLGAVQLNW
jgi:hypothetical protein